MDDDKELQEIRERKKKRLMEERKLWPIDKPLPEKLVRCPRCGGHVEFNRFEVIMGRKFRVLRCKDCGTDIIPDIGRYRVCVLNPEKPRLILPRDCKLCPHFPGKNTPCPYFRKITEAKKTIEDESGWSKW